MIIIQGTKHYLGLLVNVMSQAENRICVLPYEFTKLKKSVNHAYEIRVGN